MDGGRELAGAPGRHAGRAQRYDGVSAAVVVAALAKKLPFLERTYRAALRHHDAEPSVEEVLAERERHERVAQIIVDAEAAPALVRELA